MKLIALLLPLAANGAVVKLGKSAFLATSRLSTELIIFSGTSNAGHRWQLELAGIFGCSGTCGGYVA
jgi:hypothetical protein